MHRGSTSKFGHYLRDQWLTPRRIRFWLLIFIVTSVLLGFFAVPPIVEHYAKKIVRQDFGRELAIETVRSNPFNLTLRVDELILLDTDETPLLEIGQLDVDLAWSSVFSSGWTINSIRIETPVVHEERFTSGETRLMRLMQDTEDGDKNNDEAADPAFAINSFYIKDGELRFTENLDSAAEDDAPGQITLALEKIDFTLEDFSNSDDARAAVQFESYLAGGGELTFDGDLQVQPGFVLQGDAGVNDIALTQAAPYLQYFLGLQLESGVFSVNGQLYIDNEQPLAFEGATGIYELRISQAPDDETLMGWESLQTEQIDFDFSERKLETGIIAVDGLAGLIVINEDQTTNFSELGAAPSADDEANGEASDESNSEAVVDTKNDAGDEGQEPTPMSITIGGIELAEAAIHFADNSLPLPFSTNIHSLNGDVSTISSTSAEPARIEFEGQVEDYGLARAEGSIHAFQPTRQTDIKLTFRNLEIPEYSPYTVDFAGRSIAGGTMDLDLEYSIDNGQLEGENKLVVRDLELGEEIESDDSMSLPLNLAIALLEDSDGVMDLTLPVTGDVNDPEFDFNAIIREALGRAFTNVVEAPFRFLASLIGSESEDLGTIEFAEGRNDLSPPQRQRVAELRQALDQRPALTLEIAGPFSRDFDGPAIKQNKAIRALREHLAEADAEDEAPSLTSEENQQAVEALFASYYPDSDIEAVRARFTDSQAGASEDEQFDDLAYRNYLAEQLIAAQSVTDGELEAIGNARAAALRDALLEENGDTGITADRVRILEPANIDSVEDELIAMEVEVTTD